MTTSPTVTPLMQDQLLATILEQLTAQLRQGRVPDVAGALLQYPEIAEELRELWPAVLMAEADSQSRSEAETLALRNSSLPTALGQFGDFELLEELGRGGMGVVYKARHRQLDRVVALKMILSGPWATPDELARFRAEAALAARLDHPGIVPVYEIGTCEGKPYFSMKYVPGQTLAQLVAQGPLPSREAARYVLKVAEAVEHAHQKGILHRDLKPSNVLVDDAGEPHVSDFGLAKRVADGSGLTATGAIIGTPSYMPPEQAARQRGRLSPASDVYSLGAILYFLLTGRPPFQAPTLMDTLMQVLDQDPVPPRLLQPKVNRALENICLKCLQKEPEFRYQTAGQLVTALHSYLQGEPITGQPRSLFSMISRLLRPTHNAIILENWGLLWMWHSLLVLLLCIITQIMKWEGVRHPGAYAALWGFGLLAWAGVFWRLRQREGPITFIERQIAHVWAASVIGSMMLFLVEYLLSEPVLKLSPVLAVIAGMVFTIKAGTLSGGFYLASLAMLAAAAAMSAYPDFDILIFGVVSFLCFFVPGLKYYRQRLRSRRDHSLTPHSL